MRELAERTTGGMALALPARVGVAGGAVTNRAQAILESGLSVGRLRRIREGASRQQDLQSYRQSEKHRRDRIASHPFTSALPLGANSDKLGLYCTHRSLLRFETLCKVHVSLSGFGPRWFGGARSARGFFSPTPLMRSIPRVQAV